MAAWREDAKSTRHGGQKGCGVGRADAQWHCRPGRLAIGSADACEVTRAPVVLDRGGKSIMEASWLQGKSCVKAALHSLLCMRLMRWANGRSATVDETNSKTKANNQPRLSSLVGDEWLANGIFFARFEASGPPPELSSPTAHVTETHDIRAKAHLATPF